MPEYEIVRPLGNGAFSQVYLAINPHTKSPVAIKKVAKAELSQRQIEKLQNEADLLSRIQHRNVVRLLDYYDQEDDNICLVFEYAEQGDLLQYVLKRKCLTEDEARDLFRQVVNGVAACHSCNVLHRDIKLDNILLDNEGTVKLCDFGVSRSVDTLDEVITE